MIVHPLPTDREQTARERASSWSPRLKLLAIVLMCAAPVLASYLSYYVIRPSAGGSNYGELLDPQRPWPSAALTSTAIVDARGQAVDEARLRGNWLMVSVAVESPCGSACMDRLYWSRQLRTAQGKDRDRIDRLLILAPGSTVPASLAVEHPDLHVIYAPTDVMRRWLPVPASGTVDDSSYLLDPQANLMMRWSPGADPNRIKRDLGRLLRASVHWQVARPPRL